MEYLEKNLDWLEEQLAKFPGMYAFFHYANYIFFKDIIFYLTALDKLNYIHTTKAYKRLSLNCNEKITGLQVYTPRLLFDVKVCSCTLGGLLLL